MRFILILLGAVLSTSGSIAAANAQQGDPAERRPTKASEDDFSIPAEPSSKFETDSENIFGFTEGTDTQKQGEREISVDGIGRVGKRRFGPPQIPSRDSPESRDDDDAASAAVSRAPAGPAAPLPGRSTYRALNAKLGYQYGVTDDLSVELGLFGDARRVRNVADLPAKSFATFDGVSVELKYRLIERTRENPFGLAIEVEPRWSRVADVEGRGQDAFSLETKLLADLRIIPDRLWFATNLGWEPQTGRLRGTGQGARESMLSWSNALSLRVAETTFIGAEARYLRAYGGTYLNRLEGQALYLGPTLHHRIGKGAFVTVAYSGQVAGKDRDPDLRNRALDLTHFERHNIKIKAGVEF
jgi:hypothetical protein